MAGDPRANATSPHSKKTHKRKRDLDASAATTSTATPTKKSKKTQSPSETPISAKSKRKNRREVEDPVDGSVQEDATPKKSAVSPASGKTTTPNEDVGDARGKKKSRKDKRKSSGNDNESLGDATDLTKDAKDAKKRKDNAETSESRREAAATDSAPSEDEKSKPAKNKFSGVLSKFERSTKVKESAKVKEDQPDETEETGPEPVIAQGLEPLPQPEPVPEQVEKPTYSSLPSWLANPLRTSTEAKGKFADLGIEPNLLRTLENNGYKEAFAVQSTVIPLLLKGPKSHRGDLCISAATGSGKTLSYVLPMVTAMEQLPAPRLRGLIVVPTRELVKQAREASELCAAGSGLRVASAVGNVAIKDEQRSLMRVDQVHGPEKFKLRQQDQLTPDDWTNFSLKDYIADAGEQSESLPGYIQKTEANVDILICTPGRLVDHLRYTKGFTLKDLEWLVIDEADRLLNESFQEWVEVVMDSLDSRKATDAFGFSGKFTADVGLPIHTREPKKVILSATMTRDITKLNTLRLVHPKLVLVGQESGPAGENEDEMAVDRPDDRFILPHTLKEFTVSVGDESQKPLYLLRLLLSNINISSDANQEPSIDSAKSDTSSDYTSSEGSDSEDSDSDDTSSDGSSSDESDEGSSEDSSSDSDSESEDEVMQDKPSRSAESSVLIFTKSSESASRLSRLLALLDPSLASRIGTIIKSNNSSASRKTLTAYRQGKISIIIATDRASRGLDLQSLSHVINYDVPPSVTTYVHRVGRTARAGREGSAWTLVAHREGRWFGNEISRSIDGKITRFTKVEKVSVKLDDMKAVKSRYGAALEALGEEVKRGGMVKSSKTNA
ncbi:P-loop containing nucleoside triphosphate hydrolase protein [Aspergillus campestris IBT 28561]|uniref:ATP-dependent RNA helicase n=1 Tax=Aspergillus campestris (strain IBT 28561) TaxID=1392248 RepID=A0A2I1DHC5_ASPC2|nr:P-loop containing nucleoside triphosphate hydrolase protein [Aspergillus campestris IBT 28561]PKY09275.1 P-loop containing nucleoside triphosphate hydrolase protein [Aspergillus campestris IBT 28561]